MVESVYVLTKLTWPIARLLERDRICREEIMWDVGKQFGVAKGGKACALGSGRCCGKEERSGGGGSCKGCG